MILIKLGGSVITNKLKYMTFNKHHVSRLCDEIKRSGKDVMIVHGAGSFGHVMAKEHRLQDGYIDDSQIPGIVKVSFDMRDLNSRMMDEIVNAGIDAVSIPTGSCFQMEDGEIIGDTEIIRKYVELGIMPVMFGDVVLDRKKRFGICSGDKIIEFLTTLFNPERVIFVSDVDGLFTENPKINKNAELIETVDREVLERISTVSTEVVDVTGGVREKMESMLRMCTPERDCILLNGKVKDRLYSALTGNDFIGTRAIGR